MLDKHICELRTLQSEWPFCSHSNISTLEWFLVQIMLTGKQKAQVLSRIQTCFLLHPINVCIPYDLKGISFSHSSVSRRKVILCRLSYSIFLAHVLLKVLRLAYSGVYEMDDLSLFGVILHVTLVCAGCCRSVVPCP